MRVVEDIVGKEVLDSSATVIGKVKDIEVNLGTKRIEAIVVGKGGIFGGFGRSNNEIIIPYESVKIIGDKVLLKNEIFEQ